MTIAAPIFTDALQVAVIVRDLDAAVRRYTHEYGVGPWAILEFNPDTVSDMVIDDAPASYAMRLAVANIGRLQIELIEPLDDTSIYAKHLAEHGQGLHHVALAVDDYSRAEQALRAKGHRIIMGGNHNGVTYSYFSTDDDLGFPVELYSAPPRGKPDAVYPPEAELGGT
ncbi:MAG: VOC family protein [Solirubrobacterales bacterium]|nr:VOC family protein [Solirubrobacterales bacterium]